MLNVNPICAFNDNYIWLIQNPNTNSCAVVDPGDAEPVFKALEGKNLVLSAILITHHHGDHTGGLQQLLDVFHCPVYGPANESIPHISHPLVEGDRVQLDGLNAELAVLDVPGHTSGHIAYYDKKHLFCGDTLFAAGCGRLFEGTPAQMSRSLEKLARLPAETKVFCAHEYTLANLKFAEFIEPDNQAVKERIRQSKHLLSSKGCTLPSSIDLELQTNPFLRCDHRSVKKTAESHCGRLLREKSDVFATIREMKNHFVAN